MTNPGGIEFKRPQQKLICRGLDLNHPTNLLPPGKFPFLQNVRSYQDGRIETRAGTQRLNVTGIPDQNIHSLARVNDYLSNVFLRYAGAGTNLYSAPTTTNVFSLLDSGFSGNPLSIVPYRPDQSSVIWTYVADANRMRKFRSDGTNYAIGVAPPNVTPVAELNQPLYQYFSNIFDSNAAWTTHDSASGSATGARLAGVTISSLQYVTGTTGWVGIVPAGLPDAAKLTPGMRVNNGTETVVIEEVNFINPVVSATTVSQIQYDSGVTGLCTIVSTQNLKGLRRNAMLFIGATIIRVISVTNAPDGSSSFRAKSTVTISIGDAIVPPPQGSFWTYTNTTWAIAQALTSPNFAFAINPGGAGIGSVANNLGGTPINWGTIAAGRSAGPDDYIHFSIKIDKPELLVEGQIVFDVDPATGAAWAATDGNSNSYIKSFRASDIQPVVVGSQTTDAARSPAIETQLQNETDLTLQGTAGAFGSILTGTSSTPIDSTSTDLTVLAQGGSVQVAAGFSQYAEIKVRIADFNRIGSYKAVDLSIIRAVQLRFTVLGNILVNVGDVWVGGGYGPDTATNLTPFLYRHRYRSSATGAKSRPGPALRSGVVAQRQSVGLVLQASSDPQVDKIDIERLGGTAPEWHYIGTCPNSAPAFNDDQYTSAVIINAPLEVDSFQPFPILDKPRASVVTVVGSSLVWTSGDTFNLNWAADTEVIVNGKLTTLFATPLTTTLMFIDDSLPSGTGATLEIPEPILAGQPLPTMWGPFNDMMLATGNVNDAGSVYFTRKNDPDSAPDKNRIEVTSPGEAMMNGLVYDSRSYAFSDKRFFSILPTRDSTGDITLQFIEVRNGKGLIQKWAFTVGDKIWYVAADGIYETDGSEPVMITGDIRPIFPQGDQLGQSINGISAVDMNRTLRLCFHQSYLFFDHIDINGAARTLVYDTLQKAWFYDIYPGGFLSHFSESGLEASHEVHNLIGGSFNGFVHVHGGFSDNLGAIPASVQTPALDFGDTRAKKVFGEVVFDLDPKSSAITVQPSFDNFTNDQGFGFFTGIRQITPPIDFGAGFGLFAKNIGIKFSWSSISDAPALYYWEPSFIERPEDTFLRATDWGDGGHPGAKLIRGFLLEADAQDSPSGTRSFALQGDQATLQAFSGVFTGQLFLPFALTPPKAATLLRIEPTDPGSWRNFRVSYIFDPLPEYSAIASSYSDEGYMGAKFIQGVIVEGSTVNATSAQIQFDGDQNGPTLNLNQPGSVPFDAPYSFVPFIAHNLRLVPAGPVRLGRIRWVFEPSPELADHWYTQGTSHDIAGYQFLRDGYIAHISTAQIFLTVNVDGRNYTYIINPSNGIYLKSYLIFSDPNVPLKGRLFTYSLFSTAPFRLFAKDSEIRVHPWNGGVYAVRHPFGDRSFQDGAKI